MTQSTQSTATQLLEQILASLQTDGLDHLCGRIDRLIDMLGNNPTGNGHAQASEKSQEKVSQASQLIEFDASEIITTLDDSGTRKLFRIKGGQFSTYGLRVWPEIIESFDLDPEELQLGSTPFTKRVKALVGMSGKQKVIGLAGGNGGNDS